MGLFGKALPALFVYNIYNTYWHGFGLLLLWYICHQSFPLMLVLNSLSQFTVHMLTSGLPCSDPDITDYKEIVSIGKKQD